MRRVAALACAVALVAASRAGTERDVPYVAGGGAQQQLDLQLPATREFPTIVFVHEGGLTSGDKNDPPYERICDNFVNEGVGCVRVNYRLAPAAKWPAQPRDVAAAFAWVVRRIGARGGDSTRVVLWGHSSGCLLAALVSADGRYLAAEKLPPAAIARVIPMGCTLDPYDTAGRGFTKTQVQRAFDADRDEHQVFPSLSGRIAANPYLYVSRTLPRTLILVADSERVDPPILAEAEKYRTKARAAGATVEIAVLPGRRHMEAVTKMVDPADPTFQRILRYVRETTKRSP